MSRTLILSDERVRRTLSRLAYEVVERNRGSENLEIVGIRSRGAAVADALAREVEQITGAAPDVHTLDVAPYRDDRDAGAEVEDHSDIRVDVTDRDVILVDDVLYTGRTARAALDGLVHYGRPRSIQLAVLIDRGHREYPIQPDFLGRFIQTKHVERVVVEVDGGINIYIEE